MTGRPTPADVPPRRPRNVLHTLRIRVREFSYITPQGTPEFTRERLAALRTAIRNAGPDGFVDVPVIDGRTVAIRCGDVFAIEVGELPPAVRRALIREGILPPEPVVAVTPATVAHAFGISGAQIAAGTIEVRA